MTFGEPPLTPLPQAPPAPPADVRAVPRQMIDDFVTALGYDPAWVVGVQITPRGVTVDTVQGELAPLVHTVRHQIDE